MTYTHILRTKMRATPPWATHERLGMLPSETVLTNCCYCKMPAFETMASILCAPDIPLGMNDAEFMEWIEGNAACYYDPETRIECGPDLGCKKNPRRKIGVHLRCW